MAGHPVPGKCDYRQRHQLEVSIGLDHSLVIGFPHSFWAYSFMKCINESKHHQSIRTNACICSDDGRDVYLSLPPKVSRVKVKRDPSVDQFGLCFEFGDIESALGWHGNSRLWFQTNKHHKLSMPLEWQHDTFDRHMKIDTSLRPAQADTMGQVIGPAMGSGVGSAYKRAAK